VGLGQYVRERATDTRSAGNVHWHGAGGTRGGRCAETL
jgi:hypothetical protein